MNFVFAGGVCPDVCVHVESTFNLNTKFVFSTCNRTKMDEQLNREA